jgi:hypothetical protein
MTVAMRRSPTVVLVGLPLLLVLALLGAACSGDDEANAGAAPATATSRRSGTRATTQPTTSVPTGAALGTTLATEVGNEVTVFSIDERPMAATTGVSVESGGPPVLATVDAQFCATAGAPVRDVGGGDFYLLISSGRLRGHWPGDDDREQITDPQFPLSHTVRAGRCVRGWIGFLLEQDDEVVAVRWDANGNGTGPFLDWVT